MLHHLVLFKVRESVPQAEIERVFTALAGLNGKIPGIVSFAGGPYSSPEGLNRGFTHGFAMTFQDARSRDAYLPHPEHEKVKELVLAVLEGGIGGVVAFDFEA